MISIAMQLGIESQPIPAPRDLASFLGQIYAIAFPSRSKRERRVPQKIGHRMEQIIDALSDGLRHSTRYLARKLCVSMDCLRHSLKCMRKAGLVRKAGCIKRGKNYIALWQKDGEVQA